MKTLAVTLLATVGSAQTFIVDAANGPGTNFLDLPPAVASVASGATLIVRPGTYSGFTVSGKGMTILGGAGVDLSGSIYITNTLPGQAVTVRGLAWPTIPFGSFPFGSFLTVGPCIGSVTFEELSVPRSAWCGAGSTLGTCARPRGIDCYQCEQVMLRDCTVLSSVRLTSSHAVIESCSIEGDPALTMHPTANARPGLTIYGGSVQICGATNIRGGDGIVGTHQAGHGIAIGGTDLRLLDGQVIAGSNGSNSTATIDDYVSWPSQTRIAPRVVLVGALGPQLGSDVMPELVGAGAMVGGNLVATVTTEPGDLVVLAVGLPGPRTFLPGIQDSFWLDATLHVFVALGVYQPATPITGSAAIPNNPAFLGTRLHWQAVCQGTVTGFQATNPVVTLVR